MSTFEPYKPQKKTAAILARAMEHIKSVPYTVGARWLFYRLYQEGHFTGKDDYKDKFLGPLSEARKRNYGEWRPWTLADETRSPIYRGHGYSDQRAWLEKLGAQRCCLDRWAARSCYIEIWYEARAMTGQFEHYTNDLTLRPFGGQFTIPSKWEVVEHFTRVKNTYPDKPIEVLYFGDNDKAGNQIPESAAKDIRYWCNQRGVDFNFYRAGLNDGHETEFNIEENFEHPGTYQWEALTDETARTIITRALARFPDMTVNDKVVEEIEAEVTEKFQRLWPIFLDMMDTN